MKVIFLALITILLLNACSSPLSDTEITDPGIVYPNFSVKYVHNDNGDYHFIKACLLDKNNGYINLKVGNVKVNDELCSFSGSCYKHSSSIKFGEEYNFTVELANSNVYSSIIFALYPFKDVKIPKTVKSESFDIHWKCEAYDVDTQVQIEIKDSSGYWQPLFSETTEQNNITVSNLNLPQQHQENAKLTLVKKINSALNPEFAGGSIVSEVIHEELFKFK